jgi:hypothetical protein
MLAPPPVVAPGIALRQVARGAPCSWVKYRHNLIIDETRCSFYLHGLRPQKKLFGTPQSCWGSTR